MTRIRDITDEFVLVMDSYYHKRKEAKGKGKGKGKITELSSCILKPIAYNEISTLRNQSNDNSTRN